MSIANELSSEVAAALLSRREEETPGDSSKLMDVVIEVHSTLRHLTIEARRGARTSQASSTQLPPTSSAATGSH